ncbi:MAG: phosphatase PAP2 family protein [Jatrophihabitans sp.]
MTALVALALFGVVLLLVSTSWTPLHTLDHDVAKNLNSTVAPSPHAVDFWKAVSTIGQPLTFQAIAVLAGVLLWRKGYARLGLFVVLTVLGGGALGTIVKLLVARPRPVVQIPLIHPSGLSFPSGHALSSFVGMAVLVVLGWSIWRARRAVLVVVGVVVVTAVGFSRLALGAHYVSDIAGAWFLGLAWLSTMWVLFALSSGRGPSTQRR